MTGAEWVAEPDQQVPDDVERLLATVPEWFGQPESNAEYIEAARRSEPHIRTPGARVRATSTRSADSWRWR